MVKKKRQYSAEFKAKVALAAIREEGTLQQLSSHYGINANLISKWKQQVLAQMADLFSNKRECREFDQEETLKSLHAKIGELTVERDFLEQVSKRLGLGGLKKW